MCLSFFLVIFGLRKFWWFFLLPKMLVKFDLFCIRNGMCFELWNFKLYFVIFWVIFGLLEKFWWFLGLRKMLVKLFFFVSEMVWIVLWALEILNCIFFFFTLSFFWWFGDLEKFWWFWGLRKMLVKLMCFELWNFILFFF